MRRARRSEHGWPFCNVVVSVACVPCSLMRMLFICDVFLNGFVSPFESFLDRKWTDKSCLFTLCIAYMQSAISNTPHMVLTVLPLRGNVGIQLKSVILRA